MADRKIEWTIVNFSCWNCEVHVKTIISPTVLLLGNYRQFRLLLHISNGNMEVELIGDKNPNCNAVYSGDFSLISSNGSVICTKEIREISGVPFSLQFSGVDLKELVAEIRKNEAEYQDQLSVRFRLGNVSSDSVEYILSAIEVHKISVKVPFKKFDELTEGKPFQVIRFPLEEDNDDDVESDDDDVEKDDDDDVEKEDSVQIALLESDNTYSSVLEFFSSIQRTILVSICASVLNEEDTVLKTVEDEHVFINNGEKKTLNSLTKGEVKENHCSILIILKIIPPEFCKYRGHFYVDKGIYVALPNFLKSGSFSFVSLESPSDRTDNDPVAVLTQELMGVFQDQDYSDLQLKCGGVSLPVHKVILSARSPVFKRLLSSDMREAASGTVDIEDLDAPTLARFLAFLYTGSVEDLDGESALKLFYAADKYEVPSLKSECVSVLSAGVALSNVCDILSLADRHQDDQLMSVAHDFILRNYNEVLKSSEWESFMNREPLPAVKIVTGFAREDNVVKASTI